MTLPEGRGDSTIHRVAKGSGFDARVEPLMLAVGRRRTESGWIDSWKLRGRRRRLGAAVNDRLAALGIDAGDWDRRTGECAVALKVEKLGVLEELRSTARREEAGDAPGFPHLLALRERHALGVPLELPAPFNVEVDGEPVPVVSAPRLMIELQRLDPLLRPGDGRAALALADMMHASESDISKFESQALSDPGFWARFGYMLLTKLARAAVAHRLPIVFS